MARKTRPRGQEVQVWCQDRQLPFAQESPWLNSIERKRSIKSRIARKGEESSEKLGRHRWIVERTLAWLSEYRRLTIRYERRDDIRRLTGSGPQ